MSKIKTIYNFRIEVVDKYYNSQYNHPIHGWINLRTTSYTENEDGNYIIQNVYCDISEQNEYIKIYNMDLAKAIIEYYKERNDLDNIKKEYIYID